jgi:hypothetical protein
VGDVGGDRRGVERCAVREVHVVAKGDLEAEAVVGPLPRLGQPGLDLAVLVLAEERLEVLGRGLATRCR